MFDFPWCWAANRLDEWRKSRRIRSEWEEFRRNKGTQSEEEENH
jgi:hypothetical protein